METSLRPARRFGYSDIRVGVRPIPRVLRPAMDTIGVSQCKAATFPAETPVVTRPSPRVETSMYTPAVAAPKAVLAPTPETVTNVPRPAIHMGGHSNDAVPVETTKAIIPEEALASLVLSDEAEGGNKPTRRPRSKRRLIVSGVTLLVIGVVGVLLRTVGAAQTSQVLSAHKEVASSVVTTASSSSVTYEQPPANYLSSYQVGNMQARIISIEAIGVEARVVPVGVDGRGQPQLPPHAYDTGWYNVSAKAGEAGAVVVSGTCTTEAGMGVFDKLSHINKGDSITIERGDGLHINYNVKEIYRSPVDSLDMTKVLSPFDPKAPGLSIVTCDGAYNRATNDSADRLVVRAVQI